MSTATDLQNDPFTQGSGLSNIESALNYVHGEKGVFIVYNPESYNNIKKIIDLPIENVNSTQIGLEKFNLPSKSFPMTSWFAGQLLPGERTTATFTIVNPTNDTLSVDVKSKNLSLITKNQINGTTTIRQIDPILNKTDVFVPNYVKLSHVNSPVGLDEFFNDENPIPDNSELMILNLNFPFSEFMNSTADVYADDLKISSLYLYDWIDNDNDTKISSNELSMVNRAGSWGTVQELRVSDPDEKFDGTPLVGVYPVPTRYSYWLGDTQKNSTSMEYTLSASYYENKKWSILWPEFKTIQVPSNDKTTVNVTLVVPDDLETGVYQGFLTFTSDMHTVNAPVSFVIKQPIQDDSSTVLIKGIQSNDILYGNGYTKGAFDMVNRYMAGDWRQYYFDIQNEIINTAAIELSWEDKNTNLSVFVMDPSGKIIQTNVPSGVFGHFMGWPSLDWLGSSLFSQGGGFFPVKNKNETSTVLHVPINQTGTYTLLTHSTLFGGNSTTEPISLTAKFMNISSEIIKNDEYVDADSKSISKNLKAESEIISETITKSNESVDENSNFSFGNGIAIGIVIGIAIGIVLIFIVRQKPPK
jgi:hypothetical protein